MRGEVISVLSLEGRYHILSRVSIVFHKFSINSNLQRLRAVP